MDGVPDFQNGAHILGYGQSATAGRLLRWFNVGGVLRLTVLWVYADQYLQCRLSSQHGLLRAVVPGSTIGFGADLADA